jgi:hypothetical protein
MESWILQEGWIECDMNQSDFKDPGKVVKRFSERFYKTPLRFADNRELPIMLTLMDEGGHRKAHVHAIHGQIRTVMPYKGLSLDNMPEGKLVVKNVKRRCINGHTESLSKIVETHMNSDTWHLPRDVEDEFIAQVQRQYTKEEIDKNGNKRYVWVSGGDDHYRDCLNMALGAACHLQLDTRLNSESGIKQVQNMVRQISNAPVPARSMQEKGKPQTANQEKKKESTERQTKPPPMPRAIRQHRAISSRNPFTARQRIGRW